MAMQNRLSSRHGELLLFGSLLILFVLAFAEAPGGSPGVMPKMILVPAILITALRVVSGLKPGLFDTNTSGFFDFSNLTDQTEIEDEAKRSFSASGTAKAIVLFLLYNLGIYAIGFTLSTGLFVTVLFYYFADISLVKSAVSGAICAAFVYIVFIVALNVRPLDTLVPLLP